MENQTETNVPHPVTTIPPTPSKVTARLTHFMTVIYFSGFLAEFFSRGAFKPLSQMSIIYTSLLTCYAGEKEIRRWNGLIQEDGQGGKGDYIVFLWFLFFAFCWLLASSNPVYKIPRELTTACLSVLTIFFGSKASKRFYQGRPKKSKSLPDSFLQATVASVPSSHPDPLTEDSLSEETESINNGNRIDPAPERCRATLILDYLKKNGQITRENAAAILGVSKNTAWRTLRMLAEEGRIKWVGKWKKDPEGHYVLLEEASSGDSQKESHNESQ